VRELFTIDSLDAGAKEFFATTASDLADGWANGGIYWEPTSGIEIFVKTSQFDTDNGDGTYTHRVRLKQWPQSTIFVGKDIYLKAGCDHLMADCEDKFDNIHNFGGFPVTPDAQKPFVSFGVEA